MATYAYTFQSGDGVTPTRLNDARTVSAIQTADISDAQITAAKLASNAVETAKILDANVTTAKIADSAVTTAKINASVYVTAAPQFLRADIYKNGSQVAGGVHTNQQTYLSNVSDLIYMNGTTDYVELYATQASGTTQAATAVSVGTFMSGFLARAA